MDGENFKQSRTPNPGKNANVFSKLTFFFVWPILFLARRKGFNENDVYETIPSFRSSKLGRTLETEWNLEKQKKQPTIVRSIFRIYGVKYIVWVILNIIIEVVVMIVIPTYISRIVAHFNDSKNRAKTGNVTSNISFLLGFYVLFIFFHHSFHFMLLSVTLKIKTGCSALIYQKILKLNTYLTDTAVSGQAVTVMTKDLSMVEVSLIKLHHFLTGFVKIVVLTVMIYGKIGISTFVGLAVLISCVCVQVLFIWKSIHYRLRTAKKTDKRIQLIQEVLSSMRVIKLYTWEEFFCKVINTTRKKEIRNIQILNLLKKLPVAVGMFTEKLSLYTCVIAYVSLGNHITLETAYFVVGCFLLLGNIFRLQIPYGLAAVAELRANLGRITQYLLQDEIPPQLPTEAQLQTSSKVALINLSVHYQNRTILDHINLVLKPGLTLILGTIGAGKTSLLKAILGDIRTSGTISTTGRISYASQDPWLFSGTIKQNIVFNEVFDNERYQEVLKVCALVKDLALFAHGDETYLTDKGLNLSQGQKIRINLARAVYKRADIYLLDDCLGAVDVKVGGHVFQQCIRKFLCNKVCVLVSQLHPFINDVEEVIVLNAGHAELQGSLRSSEVRTSKDEHEPHLDSEKDTVEEAEETFALLPRQSIRSASRMFQEHIEYGPVKRRVFFKYISAGGTHIFVLLILVLLAKQVTDSLCYYSVEHWVNAEQQMSGTKMEYGTNSSEYDQAEVFRNGVLLQYSYAILATTFFVVVRTVIFYLFVSRASNKIHWSVMSKTLHAKMAYLSKNLAGSIINRFSRDFNIIDEVLPLSLLPMMEESLVVISVFVIVSSINEWLLVISIFFAIIIFLSSFLYLTPGRNIRRVEGSVRSPVIGYVQATFDGLTTIRACGAQDALQKEFYEHLDVYNSVLYMHIATVQGLRFYLDILTLCYVGVVIVALPFFKGNIEASTVGLIITQVFAVSGILQNCAYQTAEVEMSMTSAERIFEYDTTDTETQHGKSFSDHPINGQIVYTNVQLRYHQDTDFVLKGINFTIESGQKVGVVGRTGAGKSSLISALFRLYQFDGKIYMDNVDINTVRIDSIRSKISILPQTPTLFSGTIRTNLDPKSQYTDKELWNALEQVEMISKINSLEQVTKEICSTFSIGEKQLICLARVILQNNSIVILDEASACIDSYTEYLIHRIIRRLFTNRTIIIIAHQLHTVLDCDKVIVMNSGRIIECDHPTTLVNNPQSVFYGMIKEAGLLHDKKV